MSETPNKFDLFYDRLCKTTGSVFSIFHLDFPVSITIEDLNKSKTFSPVYFDHKITTNLGVTNREYGVSVYKNTENIYLYIEKKNYDEQLKLLFDVNQVKMNDVELLLMNFKKQKTKK